MFHRHGHAWLGRWVQELPGDGSAALKEEYSKGSKWILERLLSQCLTKWSATVYSSALRGGFLHGQKSDIGRLAEMMASAMRSIRELAEENKKTEVAQQKTEATQQGTEAAVKELAEEGKKTEAALQDLKVFAEKLAADNKRRGDKLERLFTGEWGKLVESLVKGGIIRLFNEKGIRINDIARERGKKIGDTTYEFDIIAVDGREMVVVEVKSTLDIGDLDNFIKKMKRFREIFPEYRDKERIHGAVAYLKENRGAARRAAAEGLWVIRATGAIPPASSIRRGSLRRFFEKKFFSHLTLLGNVRKL